MKLVIDTNILIDSLRGGSLWENLLEEVNDKGTFFIPTVVIYELFSGKSTRESTVVSKIQNILKQFQQIPLDEKIAKRAGELCRDISQTLQAPDYLIAASALEINGTVVTLNKKHFEKVPELAVYPL